MISQTKNPPACLICGGTRQLAQEGAICLCEACLRALSGALADKLPPAGRAAGRTTEKTECSR